MSSVYTGVPGNINSFSTPNIVEPSDGDADAAATFNTPFSKLTDYVAFNMISTGDAYTIPVAYLVQVTGGGTFGAYDGQRGGILAAGLTSNANVLIPVPHLRQGWQINYVDFYVNQFATTRLTTVGFIAVTGYESAIGSQPTGAAPVQTTAPSSTGYKSLRVALGGAAVTVDHNTSMFLYWQPGNAGDALFAYRIRYSSTT